MEIGNAQTKHYLDTLYRKIWRSVTHKQKALFGYTLQKDMEIGNTQTKHYLD